MEEVEQSDMAVLEVEPVQLAEELLVVVPAAAHAASLAVVMALAR